jgi:C_GCAxxG_C_C family probable redox protein
VEKQLSREELLDLVEKAAHDYEFNYRGCAQCTLKGIQDTLKVGDGGAFRSASAVSGGLGVMGDSCGALVGAIMALGLVFGRREDELDNFPALAKSFIPARALYGTFTQEFGGPTCREVQMKNLGKSFDLMTEFAQFREAGGHDSCSNVVGKAARMAAEMILDADQWRERATKIVEQALGAQAPDLLQKKSGD